jgi:hypothetical protein
MIPYLVMIAIPGALALAGVRRRGTLLLLLFLLYWIFVGLRFHVGTDWDGYVRIYGGTKLRAATELLFERESGFKLLQWLAYHVGGGLILVNAVSAFVFCAGVFAVARRCVEPYIALVVATPMLVVAFAMSATRQSLAVGIIFYLFATWEKRTTVGRVAFVFLATWFHFSSLFVLVFVALAARVPLVPRLAAAAFLTAIIGVVLYFAPETTSSYSELYISGSRKLSAPGAWVQVGALAAAGFVYFVYRKPWLAVNGENYLYHNLAIAALLAVPMIYISSVGAYRFALFFWPMAMYVWSGIPAMMERSEARLLYRICVIFTFVALLLGWLTFATNAGGWLPYQNWLMQPEGVSLWRSH